jgi:hypothetical protein
MLMLGINLRKWLGLKKGKKDTWARDQIKQVAKLGGKLVL